MKGELILMEINVRSFMDRYSGFFIICQDKIADNGEDSYVHNFNGNAGVISVFDGCGGSGGKRYEEYDNRTGAFIASRVASEKLNDWFNKWSVDTKKVKENSLISEDVKKEIDTGLKEYLNNVKRKSMLKGSIQKDFPTTMAMCLFRAEDDTDSIKTNIVWCGDSRAYYLNDESLFQLSLDDVDGEDAMSNIYGDGVLTNVISASQSYELREYQINADKKGIIFVATDGCFGYLQSPMHFEYFILKNIIESKSTKEFEKKLSEDINKYASDDFTMCGLIFGFDDFEEIKAYYLKRYYELEKEYIDIFDNATEEQKHKMWEKYQISYKRILEENREYYNRKL